MKDLELMLDYARRDADVEAVTFCEYAPETGYDDEPFLTPTQQARFDAWCAENPQATVLEMCAVIREIEEKGNGDGTAIT